MQQTITIPEGFTPVTYFIPTEKFNDLCAAICDSEGTEVTPDNVIAAVSKWANEKYSIYKQKQAALNAIPEPINIQ